MQDNSQQNQQLPEETSSASKSKPDKNEKVQQVGSAVTDGGISEESLAELEKKHASGARQGNSSIPLDNDQQ